MYVCNILFVLHLSVHCIARSYFVINKQYFSAFLVKRRIYNTRDDSSQQAEVLLSSLEESSDTRILQQFIDALKSCQGDQIK